MRLLCAVLMLLAGSLSTTPALACSCKPMTREQAIGATPIVFEGRVLRVRREGSRVYADVEMARVIKGSVPRVVEVGTQASPAACGYAFQAGQRITVGAVLSQMQFSTSSCTMTPLNPVR